MYPVFRKRSYVEEGTNWPRHISDPIKLIDSMILDLKVLSKKKQEITKKSGSSWAAGIGILINKMKDMGVNVRSLKPTKSRLESAGMWGNAPVIPADVIRALEGAKERIGKKGKLAENKYFWASYNLDSEVEGFQRVIAPKLVKIVKLGRAGKHKEVKSVLGDIVMLAEGFSGDIDLWQKAPKDKR